MPSVSYLKPTTAQSGSERIPGSFDATAGSLDAPGGLLDFNIKPHYAPVILNPDTGRVVHG
jgi:hypothetical protein